jgi:hypothetical protein
MKQFTYGQLKKKTIFGVVAVSENFVNPNCGIRKVVTSSTHGPWHGDAIWIVQ